MAGRLQGKVAIVTGGGRGIGEATARAMAAEGAKVTIAELDPATGERTAGELGGMFVRCDVREPAQLAQVAARTIEAYGRIDILVANAGVNVFHEPLAMPEEEWRRCFAVDLDGVWHSCRAVLPTMLAQGAGSSSRSRPATVSPSFRTPSPILSRSMGSLASSGRSASSTRRRACG